MIGFYLALIDEPSDKEKFRRIYELYKNIMYGTAMSILHNNADAEEAVQDSFLKIAKNIADISDAESVKTAAFINVITRNSSLDKLRRERPEESLPIDENIEDISSDVLGNVLMSDGRKFLLSAAEEMDDKYSSLMVLKFAYGYDNDSIAQILKLPKRTVENRIFRGKKILKEKLEEYYGKDNIHK